MTTTQTEQVYDFIRAYIHEVGYPPHWRDVAAYFGLSQVKVVRCLTRLQTAGRLTFRPDRPRAIWLKTDPPGSSVREIQTAR